MAKTWESVGENMVRHNPSGGMYLRAKVGGKIIRKSLGTKAVRVGKIKRDELLQELRDEVGIDKAGRSAKFKLPGAIELTLSYYSALPKYQANPSNLEYRKQVCEVIKRTISHDPSKWTAASLREWWSSDEITRYSATRRNGTLDTLRKIIELLAERGDIKPHIADGLNKTSVKTKEIIIPSRPQLAELIQDVRDQGKRVSAASADMIAFMAYSGCRINESRFIDWSDVGKDFLRVRKTKNGKPEMCQSFRLWRTCSMR